MTKSVPDTFSSPPFLPQIQIPGGITIWGEIGEDSAVQRIALMICAGDADNPEGAKQWFVDGQRTGDLEVTTETPDIEWDELPEGDDLFKGLQGPGR